MSSATANPDSTRLQTRTKNADQHPGLAVPKRKRRTQAEMKEAREKEKVEADAAKKKKEEKLLAAAKLEDTIIAKDKRAAMGTADKQKKALPVGKPKHVQEVASKVVQKTSEVSGFVKTPSKW
jgi:hypothetical protein